MIAARAMMPKTPPTVGLDHLHAPAGQRARAGRHPRRPAAPDRVCSFRGLVADADSTLVIVARFLALLELFREAAIAFEQAEALGELTVRWTGSRRRARSRSSDEFDEPDEPTSPTSRTSRRRDTTTHHRGRRRQRR